MSYVLSLTVPFGVVLMGDWGITVVGKVVDEVAVGDGCFSDEGSVPELQSTKKNTSKLRAMSCRIRIVLLDDSLDSIESLTL
jgi:hypothetical protein